MYGHIKLHSSNQFGGTENFLEEEHYDSAEEEKDDNDAFEIFYVIISKNTVEAEKTTRCTYIEKLTRHSAKQLVNFEIENSTFEKSMKKSIDYITVRYEQMEVDGKHLGVAPWLSDCNVKMLMNLLKHIDP